MSVQFGRWHFEGQAPPPDYMKKVRTVLAPYGPDSNEVYAKDGVSILYCAFHTTKESHFERQPYISSSGAVITWDGRLDNRGELIGELSDLLAINSSDVAIVSAAYEKWGTNCFAKLIGDWAISIWSPISRSLILAKDPIGTRHLYYSIDKDEVTWSTVLDPVILFAEKTFDLNQEYVAGWLSHFPALDLTPYVGVYAVPPSCSALLRRGTHRVNKYWDFDPSKKVRYRTDAEYEEHFRSTFATAVQRRLRSDHPVLAELSGGMDSSSIVCIADIIIARGLADTPRLDTISWYDDAYDHIGTGINDRPYFNIVETVRGRAGCHINLGALTHAGSEGCLTSKFASKRFAATPIPENLPTELFKQYAAYMRSQGNRVTLSGIAGESTTGGGVPTPTPELQNLLASARGIEFTRQLKAWAVRMRQSRLRLLWDVVKGFFPLLRSLPDYVNPSAPWLRSRFVRRNQAALCGYPSRIKLFGAPPSFQYHLDRLNDERKLLANWALNPEMPREVRFPYLDRDLLQFIFALPREQLVRVGERRSLMKRALAGIVPDALLNRKRKVFVLRQPKDVSIEWADPVNVNQELVSASLGIIDNNRFLEALQKARQHEEVSINSLRRTLTLESWLRQLVSHKVLTGSKSTTRSGYLLPPEAVELRASARTKSSAS